MSFMPTALSLVPVFVGIILRFVSCSPLSRGVTGYLGVVFVFFFVAIESESV